MDVPFDTGVYARQPERIELPPGSDLKIDIQKTNRGTLKGYFDGYSYTVNRMSGDKTYWRCSNRKCKGRIVTINKIIRSRTEHHHPPEDTVINSSTAESFLAGNESAHLFLGLSDNLEVPDDSNMSSNIVNFSMVFYLDSDFEVVNRT